MDLYIYSDESGVFDVKHNEIFVFGGLIFLSKADRDNAAHKYLNAEKAIRLKKEGFENKELKASMISNVEKGKLARSLNSINKFGVVVKQSKIYSTIFNDKKTKQRYLDFAYKIAIKRALENLISRDLMRTDDICHINFYIDEHTTATNGRYELREALEQELVHGTYNMDYSKFFQPLLNCKPDINLNLCDSATNTLVRAADIIANRLYHLAIMNDLDKIHSLPNMNVAFLP